MFKIITKHLNYSNHKALQNQILQWVADTQPLLLQPHLQIQINSNDHLLSRQTLKSSIPQNLLVEIAINKQSIMKQSLYFTLLFNQQLQVFINNLNTLFETTLII